MAFGSNALRQLTRARERVAGARSAILAAQRAVPLVIREVQGLLDFSPPPPPKPGEVRNIQHIPLPLLGGVTLERARQMHDMVREARVARKNLWFVRLTEASPPGPGASGVGGVLDLLALDVSYSPCTLVGEKTNVGAAVLDRLSGVESVELSMTVMDDEAGTIKRWFEAKCRQAAHPDGTFGLPVDYCVDIEIVHAVAAEDVPTRAQPYTSHFTMRPQSIQLDLSRRESGFQEHTITFTEFDSFMSAAGRQGG